MSVSARSVGALPDGDVVEFRVGGASTSRQGDPEDSTGLDGDASAAYKRTPSIRLHRPPDCVPAALRKGG
jgi:hypothetical protein